MSTSREPGSVSEAVVTAAAPAPVGPYNQAVQAAGLLFCSGQIALDLQQILARLSSSDAHAAGMMSCRMDQL